MHEHLALAITLTTTLLIGSMNTFAHYRRDWCGVRLLPSVALERLPAMFLIALVYVHVVHVLPWPMVQERYALLLYGATALAAEYLVVHRVLHSAGSKSYGLSVATKIARKKVEIADQLEPNPDCRQTLIDAIYTSDLNDRKKRSFITSLRARPSREQILDAIKLVGLAHIKVMVPKHKEIAHGKQTHDLSAGS